VPGSFTVPDEVRDVLRRCEITSDSVKLPDGQLDRKLYLAVNKVLEAAGGKWSRRDKLHVFDRDPREALGLAVEQGTATNTKQALGQFYTPHALADKVAALANIDEGAPLVLEPSFGGGALIRAVWRRNRNASVSGIEIDDRVRLATTLELTKHGPPPRGLLTMTADFLKVRPEPPPYGPGPEFDAVVMNPPFAKDADAAHVLHALKFLKPGGRLVSIMAGSATKRSRGKTAKEFVETYERLAGYEEAVPDESFRDAGTSVRTLIVRLVKR
jgi:type I restriction-modification system DNA methylase subunit